MAMRKVQTFEIFGCENDGTEMVVLNQSSDLGRDFYSIPSHNQ